MRPLEGIRVLDLTVAVAGPVATHLLADLGADVIRIDPPFARPVTHADVAPVDAGAPADAGARPYDRIVSYNDLQRGKRGVTLDLAQAAGREIALGLVAHCDAVVENMAPRVLPSLGLAYDALRAANPRIILVSMPAFGLSGPWRDRVSFGPGIDAMSGLASLTGYPDRGPMNAANYFCDYNAGALAAFATVAALRQRERTGAGQHVELSMLEGELQLVAGALIEAAARGRVTARAGNAHPSMSPHGAYQCAGDDRWIVIACEDDAQWCALAAAIGAPGLAGDARFADVIGRLRRRDEVDAVVAAWTRGRDASEAAAQLQAAGVPAAPVLDVASLFDDPQIRHRQWIQWVRHDDAGMIPHTSAAFSLTATPFRIERRAPRFGEHNDEVLRRLLGLDDARMDALRDARVIAGAPPPAG